MKRALATLMILLLTWSEASWSEACMVLDESEKIRTGPDGPGSFGPLQDTLSLGCLDYIEFEERDSSIAAVVRDHLGRNYRIEIGAFVGENTGRVVRITPRVIMIEQIVLGESGEWEKLERFLHRSASAMAN